MRRSQRAYSIAEILVILAILAIIAVIVLPILASSRAAQARSGCLVRLRNVGTAMELYAASSDGYAPYDVVERMSGGRWTRRVWSLLTPYMRTGESIMCPDLPQGVVDPVGFGYPALPLTFGSRLRTPLQFSPSSVVAFCWDHLEGELNFDAPELSTVKLDRDHHFIGRFHALRQDLSASVVDAQQVEGYIYDPLNRAWHPVLLQPRNMKVAQAIMRFPSDPWPAEFQESPSPWPGSLGATGKSKP